MKPARPAGARRSGDARSGKQFGFPNFLLGSPNSGLADSFDINDLTIWISKEFPWISKFLFGGFVEYQ